MNISFFLIKNDLVNFLKKNVAKFIVAAILLVLTAVLAVRNAVTTDGIREYFEGKGSALYAFMRGDCSLFFLMFTVFMEYLILLIIILLCSYSDFTLFLSFGVIVYKAYIGIYNAVIVLRYYGLSAVFFNVTYIIFTIVSVFVYVCYISYIIGTQYRYRFGFCEVKCILTSCIPFYVVFLALYLLQILVICLGCVFI